VLFRSISQYVSQPLPVDQGDRNLARNWSHKDANKTSLLLRGFSASFSKLSHGGNDRNACKLHTLFATKLILIRQACALFPCLITDRDCRYITAVRIHEHIWAYLATRQ
jgi:hypothetical protein